MPLAVGPAMSATFGRVDLFIATLIAATLPQGEVSAARDRLDVGWLPAGGGRMDRGRVRRATCSSGAILPAARAALAGQGYDVVVQPAEHRRKTLIIADMDSTMITVECVDELADYAGIKAEVAAVTEAAMRGEMDFGAGARRAGRATQWHGRSGDRPLPRRAGQDHARRVRRR